MVCVTAAPLVSRADFWHERRYGMKPYIFFSVHEPLFHLVAADLAARGASGFSGFLWSTEQEKAIANRGVPYHDLIVFSRDLLPKYDEPPDLAWLARRERELGVSVQRMLEAERHLIKGRTFEQIMRVAEVGLRTIGDALDRIKPDALFSEDVSCFHSYAHRVLAHERGIKFWAIGTGRLPGRISVYSKSPQIPDDLDATLDELRKQGLTPEQRALGEAYIAKFRDRPARPTGMETRAARPKIELADARRLATAATRFFGDRGDPTAIPPWRAMTTRLTRMSRVAWAEVRGVFDDPVPGERYVLYPIHFQPEASTLVQAPMYLDQVNLVRDIAASLPIGVRLYVKEHVSNRGRRPLSFYEQLRALPSVRLLGPDTDVWPLIRNASAIAVITGTMGWEGLLFDKPVVTFGSVFFNLHPSVLRASDVPKDRWYELFARAVDGHVVDHDETIAMVVALHAHSRPGFIANPSSFREVLQPDNVRHIADALAEVLGLS